MLPRGFALRTGAALGIMLTSTTTGLGGASLDWDRRRRVTPVQTKSQEAWPDAEPLGWKRFPKVRAAVERRQMSAHQKGASRTARCGGYGSAFAGVPPSLFVS